MNIRFLSFLGLSAFVHAALLAALSLSPLRIEVQPSHADMHVMLAVWEDDAGGAHAPGASPPIVEPLVKNKPSELRLTGKADRPLSTGQTEVYEEPDPAMPDVDAVVKTAASPLADNKPPLYPRNARRAGHQGVVILNVQVGVCGEVLDVEVHASSGYDALDKEAERTIRLWRFKPATRAGVAVQGRAMIPIRFVLSE